MTVKLQELKATLAEVLGEAPSEISALNPRWTQLMKEGVIVSLHIRRWRATASLSEADLGIGNTDEDELQEIMKLGDKFLLPVSIIKQLNSIDAGARTLLAKSGYKTYWGYLIPVTKYQDWKADNQVFIDRYYELREYIFDNWNTITDDLVLEYTEAARKAYRRRRALDPGTMGNEDWANEDEFIDHFIDRVLRMRPSASTVRDSFDFEVSMNYIPLPSILEDDLQSARSAAIRAELERKGMIEQAELQAEKEKAEWDLELAKLQAEEEQARLEQAEARTKAEERIDMLRQMNRDVISKAKEQKEELVNQFLKDLVTQLRGTVYEVVEDVATAIDGTGKLHPRKVVQLKQLIEKVGTLNFYDDVEIEQMIIPLKEQLALQPQDRNPEEISKTLKAIGILTRSTLIGLGEAPRKARVRGIPVKPTEVQKRKARVKLGIEVEVEQAKPRQARLKVAVVEPVAG